MKRVLRSQMKGPARRGPFALAGLLVLPLLLAGCGGEPPPNVVLIVLDTVRADHTGRDGAGGSATPNLDHLASRGTLFAAAWADAPWTVPSHASLFTGLPPWEHGCGWTDTRLAPQLPTVAERLGRAGYRTAAFYSNPALKSGLLRGFAEQVEVPLPDFFDPRRRDPEGDQGGRRTADNFARWLQERRGEETPFFAFLNVLEAHLPYDPPPEVRRRYLAGLGEDPYIPVAWAHEVNSGFQAPEAVDWPLARALYRGDVLAADEILGRILAALDRSGLRERTVVIVTSDHGENLGEHGLAEHQYSLHETLLAVPLVIWAPAALQDGIPPGRREEPVHLADLHATLLDLAGSREAPPAGSVSLLRGGPALPADRPLTAEYDGPNAAVLRLLTDLKPDLDTERLSRAYRSLRVGAERLTVASDGSRRLHDLAADPGELRDLAPERPARADSLAARLAEICPRELRPALAEGAAEMDPETRRRLRSLGYVR